MPAPIIGITTYSVDENGSYTLPREYVDAVRRAGGIPVLVCPGETRCEDLLESIDGLVLAGGGDLTPSCYGGSDHETIYLLDESRDQTELELARLAIERKFPTFAICRGIQIINVALGGTLVEHLPDEYGESILHRLPPRKPTPHAVTIHDDSRLAELLGRTDAEIASWHHQSIRRVADGLRVVAEAADGVIEAVEMPDNENLIAVQWHPELTAAKDDSQQALFNTFVEWSRESQS